MSDTLPGDHVLFITFCISFGKFMVSKRNQLDRGPRPRIKTMEYRDRPIIQFNKQSTWEYGLDNFAQDEGSQSLFLESGHLLPYTQDVRFLTNLEPLTLVRTQSDSDSSEKNFVLFPTHLSPGPFVLQGQFCPLPAGSKFYVSRAMKTQGRLGTPPGSFATQLCRFSLF